MVRNVLTNRLERLTFKRSSGGAGAPAADSEPVTPASVQQTTATSVTVDLPRASVEHYLANLPELLSSAIATPHAAGIGNGPGAVDGFELSQIKAGGLADQVGFKNGDVIQEVNGEKLDSVAAAIRLFGRAQTMAQVTLTVMRGGQRLTFVVNTK